MASPTANQVEAVRDHVGDVGATEIEDTWARLEAPTTASVARVILGRRYAEMMANPAKFSADGQMSEDFTANLQALGEQITALDTIVSEEADTGGGVVDLTATMDFCP